MKRLLALSLSVLAMLLSSCTETQAPVQDSEESTSSYQAQSAEHATDPFTEGVSASQEPAPDPLWTAQEFELPRLPGGILGIPYVKSAGSKLFHTTTRGYFGFYDTSTSLSSAFPVSEDHGYSISGNDLGVVFYDDLSGSVHLYDYNGTYVNSMQTDNLAQYLDLFGDMGVQLTVSSDFSKIVYSGYDSENDVSQGLYCYQGGQDNLIVNTEDYFDLLFFTSPDELFLAAIHREDNADVQDYVGIFYQYNFINNQLTEIFSLDDYVHQYRVKYWGYDIANSLIFYENQYYDVQKQKFVVLDPSITGRYAVDKNGLVYYFSDNELLIYDPATEQTEHSYLFFESRPGIHCIMDNGDVVVTCDSVNYLLRPIQ